MIKRETIVLLFSIAMGIVIITVLTFFIIWICFPAESPKETFKDALGLSGGFFGGFATLGAAIVAAHLFSDWRDAHNKSMDSQMCMKTFDYFHEIDIEYLKINNFLNKYLENKNTRTPSVDFDEYLIRLENLTDEITVVLSELGYIIPKTKYDEKFITKFENLIDNLEYCLNAYKENFKNTNDEDFSNKWISVRAIYRATLVELAEYYKALT